MDKVINIILFSNVINLFLVIVFFVWVFRKFNLLSFIFKKREELLETMKNLEHDRKIKEHKLEIAKGKLKKVDDETTKIIDEGEQVAESIADRIIEEAEKEAAGMQKKAYLTIENERKIAKNETLQEIIGLAFAKAEIQISEAVDDDLHRKYIDNFIDNLGNLNE